MGALPSAEADSACSTLSFPALTCRAITCRASRLEFGGSYSTALPGIRFPRILLRAGLSHSAPFGAGAALPFRQCTQCPADYRANISCTCALNFGYSGSFCNSGNWVADEHGGFVAVEGSLQASQGFLSLAEGGVGGGQGVGVA
jgi:hypothetical protein